ncbi:hypothetical protein F4553_002280 [Allocatelliglobosispora scoriae]|uniref:Uncharacterized protein n=1 Tax=Allocatelliglobosispora scoriae TaxID=643052 RepID=A0A841BPZ2_9ACTN|nr:hypothetical protein [Allocatelliglobosispora scoriae]MBB5868901.1 hypothetical protein [Allocatelliglobosispora scoriae]
MTPPLFSPRRTHRHRFWSAAAVSLVTTAASAVIVLAGGVAPAPAYAADAPGSCVRVIDGVEWNLDPCIPEGAPLPQDFADTLATLRACQSATPTPTATPTGGLRTARQAAVLPTSTAAPSPPPVSPPPVSQPPTSPPVSPPPTSPGPPTSPSAPPPTSPVPTTTPGSPSTSPSSPPGQPYPCPDPTTPVPWPTPSPTASPDPTGSPSQSPAPSPSAPPTPPWPSPSPSPSASPWPSPSTPPWPSPSIPPSPSTWPSPSTSPSASPSTSPSTSPSASASPSPSDGVCTAGTPTGHAPQAEKDESADLIECRDPAKIPDPKKPVTLVATGDSLTSAHHQTGFGIGVCDNTAADFRALKGNDATFSYAGLYFGMNKQITSYYNFARTGFTTSDIRGAAAATTDACTNVWGRNGSPLAQAEKVIAAAKKKGDAAYYVTTGGVNNTNWTTVVAKLAECAGLDFAMNNLLAGAGNVGAKVKFYYVVPKAAPTDPPLGLKKNIIAKGGACYARVDFAGQLWWTRVGVPAYDGPGSAAVSPLAAAIGPDVTAIVNAVLAKGADKVVWMPYYDISPANIDVANLGLAAAKAKLPAWAAGWLPATVAAFDMSLIDPLWVGDVRKLVKDLNDVITLAMPANAKAAMAKAAVLLPGDIQNTGIGGSPHPNAKGQQKLATCLDTAFKAL